MALMSANLFGNPSRQMTDVYKRQKDENGNELKDANGNRILDEEADYSGYFRDIQWKNKTIT